MKAISLFLNLVRRPFMDNRGRAVVNEYRAPSLKRAMKMSQPELVQDFLRFMRTKPRDEKYDYSDNLNCAMAQYAKNISPTFRIAGHFFILFRSSAIDLLDNSDQMRSLMENDTFGAAADALELALK